MTGLPDLDAVSCVRAADVSSVRAWLDDAGFARLDLDGAGVTSAAELWAAVAGQLPVPPAIAPTGWDAFKDAMFEVISTAGGEPVALVWLHSEDLVAGDLQDFLVAASVLENLTAELVREHGGLRFVTFACGEGPGYRAFSMVTGSI